MAYKIVLKGDFLLIFANRTIFEQFTMRRLAEILEPKNGVLYEKTIAATERPHGDIHTQTHTNQHKTDTN